MTWILVIAVLLAVLVVAYAVESVRRRSRPVKGGIKTNITLPHSQEFELYSNEFSHCSRKARLVMAELDIPYKPHMVSLIECGTYENIRPKYLRVNRAGLVPTLVHKGHPIYESDDILAYAAEHAAKDGKSIVPADAGSQAEMNEWIEKSTISSDDPLGGMDKAAGPCIPPLTMPLFFTAIKYIPFHRIAEGLLFHPDKVRPIMFITLKLRGVNGIMKMGPLSKMILRARDSMAEHLKEFDTHLERVPGPWIGEDFSLADIAWAALCLRLEETGWLQYFHDRHGLANVAAFYEAIKGRSSWTAAIDNHRHPIIEQATVDFRRAVETNPKLRTALYT